MHRVHITKEAHDYVRTAVMAKKGEIGGFGFASRDAAGRYVWHTSFLVPQIASASEVNYEETGGVEFAVEKALKDGVFEDPHFLWVKWHSHGGLASYWSGTDDTMNEKLHLTGVSALIDHVTNRKNESKTRLEMYDVDHKGLYIPQLTLDNLDLIQYVDDTLVRSVLADIEKLVTERKFVYTQPKQGQSGSVQRTEHQKAKDRDLPGAKVEDALDQRAWGFEAEPPSGDAAYELLGDDDEPWLPTLWNADALPADAIPLDDQLDLDDPTLDGFEAAGFTIVKVDGQRFLVDSDALDDELWGNISNVPDAESYELVNAAAVV